jgi:SOS response associated peptidase (SRAP)
VINGYVGNLPPMPGVFPDYPAPVVRNAGGDRELTMMRWGMPPPARGIPVTNIRNTSSPHWRAGLRSENRCLVPANSFAEYAPERTPKQKRRTWCGSLSMRIGRCSPSVGSGPNSETIEVRSPSPSRPSPGLGLPNDGAQRRRRADPSESHAGYPNDRARARCLDARALG